MKKIICLAVSAGASATLFALPASAQSKVELYGIVDLNVEAVNHSPSASGGSTTLTGMRSGARGASRWGLRGSEKLGNGAEALFELEAAFDATNGQATGGFFSRTAAVGIKSPWGQVLLGRQRTPTFLYSAIYEPTMGAGQYGPLQHLVTPRHDNLVTYSYVSSGLSVGGHYGFSTFEQQMSDDLDATSTYGAAIAYRPTKALGGYLGFEHVEGIRRDTLSAAGRRDGMTNIQTGVRAERGPWAAILSYRYRNVDRMVSGEPDVKSHLYMAGLEYRYAANSVLSLAYYNEDYRNRPQGWRGTVKSTVHQLSFAAIHGLSKRTQVYGLVAHAVNGPVNMGASSNYRLAQGKDSQTAVAVGIRHRF